jgi:hypothetical protein
MRKFVPLFCGVLCFYDSRAATTFCITGDVAKRNHRITICI